MADNSMLKFNARSINLKRIALVIVSVRSLKSATQTLECLLLNDPLTKKFGQTFLIDFAKRKAKMRHPDVKIVCLPNVEESIRSRVALNWVLSNESNDYDWVCICEDDISFRENFSLYLRECLSEVVKNKQSDTILSLYSPYDTRYLPHKEKGQFYVSYTAEQFYGTQCLLYSRTIFSDLKVFIDNSYLNASETLDVLLNLYFRKHRCLLASKVSLVQHNHKSRTGVGGAHRSPSYDRVWIPGLELSRYYQQKAKNSIKSRRPHKDTKEQRGIVICAGGDLYFTCAWVCIRLLRHLGCELPIEVWHLGETEMSDDQRALIEPFGVRCVDALKVRKKHPVRFLKGWELKCYSILYSNFEEVLLLDADNVPVRDPTFLFDEKEYLLTGAVFWPDLGRTAKERDIWGLTGVQYKDEREFESGQILVNKKSCWQALVLAMHYNEHSDFYYQHIYGDKDTFRFAFRKLGKSYSMPDRGIDHLERTLCQHDFDGKRIFQHRVKKWSLVQREETIGFLHELTCYRFLDELYLISKKKVKGKDVDRAKRCTTKRGNTVNIRAPIGSSTGYELHAHQIYYDLTKLGYNVQMIPTSFIEKFTPIPSKIRRSVIPDSVSIDNELLLHPPLSKPYEGRRTAYFTMWESSQLPKAAVKNLNLAEAIIVPCQWNLQTFEESGVKVPIYIVPLGIKTEVFSLSDMLMDGPCVFGAAGRSDSDSKRKGFNDIVPIFRKAFPREKDVKLKIKVFPHCKIDSVNDPRIEIQRGYLTENQLSAWYRSLTCFVSTSRSEGWGLMPHQAFATGRPVIGAIFGGVSEFFKSDMGYSVNFKLTPSKGRFRGYGFWAQPDRDDIIEAMRQVYHDRKEARMKGIHAANEVKDFSWMNSNMKLVNILRNLDYIN